MGLWVEAVSVMAMTMLPQPCRAIGDAPRLDPDPRLRDRPGASPEPVGPLACDAVRMTTTAPAPAEHRRLYRAADGRVLGGVAAGLAERLGIPAVALRVAFAALTLAGGAGVVMYAAFWVFVPQHDQAG